MPETSLRKIKGLVGYTDFNRLVQAIRAASAFTVGGGATDAGLPGGRILQFDRGGPVYGQVVSGSNPYTVNLVAPKAGGGWLVTAPGGIAYEVAGRTDVPAGRVVELLPGFRDESRFQDVRRGGCKVTFTVLCTNHPGTGATVTVTDPGTGASVSGVADSNSRVKLDLSGVGGAGSYNVTVSGGPCQYIYSATMALAACGSYILNCCQTCFDCAFNTPWPDTIHITDSYTTVTLTGDPGNWSGCYVMTVPGPAADPCGCRKGTPSEGGSCTIAYQVICDNGNLLRIQRTWGTCGVEGEWYCADDPADCTVGAVPCPGIGVYGDTFSCGGAGSDSLLYGMPSCDIFPLSVDLFLGTAGTLTSPLGAGIVIQI